MCKWGTEELVEVTMPPELSYTGEARKALKGIDSCIASLVRELNSRGHLTANSCCGHGQSPGKISFHDGKILTISEAKRLIE